MDSNEKIVFAAPTRRTISFDKWTSKEIVLDDTPVKGSPPTSELQRTKSFTSRASAGLRSRVASLIVDEDATKFCPMPEPRKRPAPAHVEPVDEPRSPGLTLENIYVQRDREQAAAAAAAAAAAEAAAEAAARVAEAKRRPPSPQLASGQRTPQPVEVRRSGLQAVVRTAVAGLLGLLRVLIFVVLPALTVIVGAALAQSGRLRVLLNVPHV